MADDFRFYRSYGADGEKGYAFRVKVETTDLFVRAGKKLEAQALEAAREARARVERHIADHPEFATSLTPLEVPGGQPDPMLAAMYAAGLAAGTGPMAAVAGTIAREVGRALARHTRRVLVENGGDIWADWDETLAVGLFAGDSPFSGKLALELEPGTLPVAICTSSATVGPSLSYGAADAATVVAPDAALADAVATALGNRIGSGEDLEAALEWALSIPGVTGALAVIGDRLGCKGELKLIKM